MVVVVLSSLPLLLPPPLKHCQIRNPISLDVESGPVMSILLLLLLLFSLLEILLVAVVLVVLVLVVVELVDDVLRLLAPLGGSSLAGPFADEVVFPVVR